MIEGTINPLQTESDVEQKFIYKFLTDPMPDGLDYFPDQILTKVDIRKITIDKGKNQKLYYPDYAIVLDGMPCLIIEAKAPGERDLEAAFREARLYSAEINANYQKNINPCTHVMVTNGIQLLAGYWDNNTPIVNIPIEGMNVAGEEFVKLLNLINRECLHDSASKIRKLIRKESRYLKPVHMLGGKSVINETVGENSFGSNISLEYKYLFNPERDEDKEAIVNNAYVSSKRKQSHVVPIDKIIRATMPSHLVDSRSLSDTEKPTEIIEALNGGVALQHELCLLIGSVGSGKSTFTDYLNFKALPQDLRDSTFWLHINLNNAPLSKEVIYNWVVEKLIREIKNKHSGIDFDKLSTLKELYKKELEAAAKGRASLFPKDSEKYLEIISEELLNLQKDLNGTLISMIEWLFSSKDKLLVVVFDNCDKRTRDDQLLMFEVAAWMKSTFPCMIFLPLRDTTYDQYSNVAPLDTVIKDLVFRIEAPLLEKVIYSRLKYALREISSQSASFTYYTSNNMKIVCTRGEVGDYLRCIISSLFQNNVFKSVIKGIVGRNIRKGLEILMDFCKSGHISPDLILKMRTSKGEFQIPHHLIYRVLLKGNRKYFDDVHSNFINLFHSTSEDELPDPFVRIDILFWLHNNFREKGPNNSKGFHMVERILRAMQNMGHSRKRVLEEIKELHRTECIMSESLNEELNPDDLISITASGFTHLDLIKNITYLSTVAEDTLFRDNNVARNIADNLVGKGKFSIESRAASIDTSMHLVDYLSQYNENLMLGNCSVHIDNIENDKFDISELKNRVETVSIGDKEYNWVSSAEKEYPKGTELLAQVVSIQDYGFFVEFGINGSGLVHKSNFNNVGNDILNTLEEADNVIVEVIKYSTEHNRMSFKLIDL